MLEREKIYIQKGRNAEQISGTGQYCRVAKALISYKYDRSEASETCRDVFQPFISCRCRSSATRQPAMKASSMSHTTMDARDPLSLPDSDIVRVWLGAGLVRSTPTSEELLVALTSDTRGALARMVAPFHSPSSSSSARLAKTSGSSCSGGKVDIQHMRDGSNTMLPTTRAPDANEPMEETLKWVINAGRVDVPTAASKSRSTCSLPSHRSVWGFHFMSPTTKDMVNHRKQSKGIDYGPFVAGVPPKLRIRVGFRRVAFVGEVVGFFFFFFGLDSGFGTASARSIRVEVRRSVFVEGARGIGVSAIG